MRRNPSRNPRTIIDPSLLIPTADVAQELGITKARVRNLAHNKKLMMFKCWNPITQRHALFTTRKQLNMYKELRDQLPDRFDPVHIQMENALWREAQRRREKIIRAIILARAEKERLLHPADNPNNSRKKP